LFDFIVPQCYDTAVIRYGWYIEAYIWQCIINPMDKKEILEAISRQKLYLHEKYHVKNIGVFGSVARDEQTENSDVDVLVEFESPIGFFEFVRMEDFLSGILRKKVDLVSRKALKSAMKDDVLKETIYV